MPVAQIRRASEVLPVLGVQAHQLGQCQGGRHAKLDVDPTGPVPAEREQRAADGNHATRRQISSHPSTRLNRAAPRGGGPGANLVGDILLLLLRLSRSLATTVSPGYPSSQCEQRDGDLPSREENLEVAATDRAPFSRLQYGDSSAWRSTRSPGYRRACTELRCRPPRRPLQRVDVVAPPGRRSAILPNTAESALRV